jgi:PKD repeat protein
LTVTVEDGSIDTDTLNVTVLNIPPTVEAGDNLTIYEGALVNFSGNFSDPSWLDTHMIVLDLGNGSNTSGTLTPTHVYGDNGVYTVTLTVTDDDGGIGADTLTITVNNVVPSLRSILALTDPIQIGTEITASVDSRILEYYDTHTAEWTWGDGNSSAGTVSESGGLGSVSNSYTYTSPGVFIPLL